MWTKIRLAIVLIVAVLVLILVFQNRDSVETKFLFATVTMPRAALLFVTLVIGFAIGVLTAWSLISRSSKKQPASKDGS